VIDFTYVLEGDQYFLNGTGTVNRIDGGVKGNFLGFSVGKEIVLTLKAPAQFQE